MSNYIERDSLIQFIEGNRLEHNEEKRKINVITNKIQPKKVFTIKYDVSIPSSCDEGIYVSDKNKSYWLDRQQRSYVEFNIGEKTEATKLLSKLENLDYVFAMYNSEENTTVTNIGEEEKHFNLIRERSSSDKNTLSSSKWEEIKNLDRNYTTKAKSGYSFVVVAPEYCTGDVEKDLGDIIN